MACGLEPDEVPSARLRCRDRKRSEAVVFPHDVLAALDPVSDAPAALSWQTDELPVTEQGTEDHLKLQGVRRDPGDRDLGMLDHTHEFDRRLRPTPSGLARLRAGPRVAQAHPRELERRRHHLVPERPHVRRRVERDLGRRVPTDEVVDREPLERIDYGATHTVARGLGITREVLSREAIALVTGIPDAVAQIDQ